MSQEPQPRVRQAQALPGRGAGRCLHPSQRQTVRCKPSQAQFQGSVPTGPRHNRCISYHGACHQQAGLGCLLPQSTIRHFNRGYCYGILPLAQSPLSPQLIPFYNSEQLSPTQLRYQPLRQNPGSCDRR